MAVFIFQAKATDGRFIRGEVEATSEAEARIKIRAQKMIPLKVSARNESNKEGKKFKFFGGDKVTPKDLQVFTRQFSVLIGAGVPVVQSIEALVEGARSPAMGKALEKIIEDVERGKRLAESMAKQPLVFDKMYVNLITAGEEGGVLDTVLDRLAEYIEKSAKLRGKVTGALWYPGVIIFVAFGVITGILVFVIPQFVDMFESMGSELPVLTKFVLDLSDAVQRFWYMIVGLVVGVPILVKAYYQTDDGRKTIDSILIAAPVFGPLVQKGGVARLCRTLATLLQAGVRIMDSLDIAANTAGNYVLETAIKNAKESVSKGKTLAEPMKQEKYLPTMVVQMISVGEQTGNLDTMLGKIADFYEEEVEAAAEAMTSLIEPILMVFLGGIIAVLVTAMYLPIFNLASAVG